MIQWSVLSLALLPVALLPATALADDDYCPATPETARAADSSAVRISADEAVARANKYARLEGKVRLTQGDNKLYAERIDYNVAKQRLNAKGQVLYTNCSAENPAWFIKADQISITSNRVSAKDAWFVFGNVPLLYLPRYHITLNETRKSGFLTPRIDSSSETGLGIKTPFYFNLAPNQDMTFSPQLLTKRGLKLNNDYRYLTHFGSGKIHADWLNDNEYDSNRYSYAFRHDKNSDKYKLNALYQRVSDLDYTDDFRGPLQFLGDNYLRSYAQLDRVWNGWRLNGVVETIQASDRDAEEDTRPFEKRPDISLFKRFRAGQKGGEFNLYTNWTLFDYRGTDEVIEEADGRRFDNFLQWRLPFRRPGFFLEPAAQMRYTRYDLDRDDDDEISRTIPSFSLRSGLIFEKHAAGGRYKKTLEPQIYYLNVPYRNQSSIPLYDTDEAAFRFDRIFADSRFEGADRISDADQLSFAMTHRMLHSKSGKEVLRASLGQIFFFRKNRVNLAADAQSPFRNKSDIAGELIFNLNDKIRFYNSANWDTEDDRTQRMINRLSLNAGNNRLVNLFHHYQRDNDRQIGDYKQLGVNFSLPVASRWQLLGAYSYDTNSDRDLVTMAGLEYRSCCWRTRLLGQRFVKNIGGDGTLASGDLDYERTFGIEFQFRGLGSVDANVGNILENRITGYNY